MIIDLTPEQLNRLKTIVACHVDLSIQSKIDEAMQKMEAEEVARLITIKREDQLILAKLWEAKL